MQTRPPTLGSLQFNGFGIWLPNEHARDPAQNVFRSSRILDPDKVPRKRLDPIGI